MRSDINSTYRSDERKKRALLWIIIFLQIIIIILLLVRCEEGQNSYINYSGTAVIEDALSDKAVIDDGRMRICMNTTINIKKGVMQDLNFINYNEGRLQRIEIVYGQDTIYTSDFVGYEKKLKGDYIDIQNLGEGINNAIARVYMYDMDGADMGQANVEVRLVK